MAFFYSRLRHTYGYGVHSPSAYRFVKDVLSPGRVYRWYGYEDIEQWIDHWMGTPAGEQSGLYTSRRILQKDARLLHRMVAGMDCHMVWIPKQAPTPLVAAIKMANHSIKIVHDPSRIAEADLVVATGDTLSEESLSGIPGLKLIWLRMPEKANPQSLLKGGFALNGRHRAVVMNNDSESTSRHIYSIL